MKDLKNLVTPFANVSAGTMMLVGVITYAAIIGLWFIAPNQLIPSPLEVFGKFGYLVSERGLFHETMTSLKLNLQATAIAGTLAMLFAYLWVYPVMRPLIGMLENWRFAGLVGIGFFFMLYFKSAHMAKLAAVVFVMLPYILTSLVDTVKSIEEGTINHAKTLKLGSLHTIWEIGLWGSRDRTIEAIRQGFPMGWATTAVVEGWIRTEGGVGLMIVEQAKYLKLADLFATMLFILILGMIQNKVLNWIRAAFCPYSEIGKGAR